MGNKASGGYLACLMCDAEVPVSLDEVGLDVYCSYCELSMKLRKDEEEDDLYLEEDDWG